MTDSCKPVYPQLFQNGVIIRVISEFTLTLVGIGRALLAKDELMWTLKRSKLIISL